jgi:hypothetical protein
MTAYLAWSVPAALAVGLAVYAARSRTRGNATPSDVPFPRLVVLLLVVLGAMFFVLWLVLDALSETTRHAFTLPAIVSLVLIGGFAGIRILR